MVKGNLSKSQAVAIVLLTEILADFVDSLETGRFPGNNEAPWLTVGPA